MSDYLLLTGCTGLLGRYLLRDLLLEGRRLAVVARPSRKESAEARVEAILQMWEAQLGKPLPRPICLEGNVCEPSLGLSDQDQQWVADNCAMMMHSAASLTFHADGSGEPEQTNVGGTRNVLDLCQSAGIEEMHYVSTAYVCGLREELVMEGDLDFGQDFRNDYEQTKLAAEMLVRDAGFKKLTVYRPAVIAGDSQTGYTNTYHGLYMYLKLMAVLNRNTEPSPDGVRFTPVRLNMTGDEPRNIIPVDWVSTVMCHLLANPETCGKTFHIAPNTPLTPREIIDAGYTYFNSRGVEFAGRADDADNPISDMDRDAHDNMGMYKEYEASDPHFDLTNLHKYAGHLPCPVIDEAMLHRFWKYGEDDRWGKRRAPVAESCDSVAAALSATVKSHDNTGDGNGNGKSTIEHEVSLDVLGRGGGQFTLAIRNRTLTKVSRGISATASEHIALTVDEFSEWNRGDADIVLTKLRQRLQAPAASGLIESIASAVFSIAASDTRQEPSALGDLHGVVQTELS